MAEQSTKLKNEKKEKGRNRIWLRICGRKIKR
jgi:hypothetical protein